MRPLTKDSIEVVSEEWDGPTREVEFWGFRTRADRRDPRQIAWDFLQTNARLFNLEGSLDTLDRPPRVIKSLGARHVLYQQKCGSRRIHRGYVTVHMDLQGRVYLLKNHAVPKAILPKAEDVRFPLKSEKVAREHALNQFRNAENRRVPAGGRERLRRMERLVYWKKGRLYPVYRFRLHLERPWQEWIVYVDALGGRVLDTYDNLANLPAQVRVFDHSPSYRYVTLKGLRKQAVLDGRYVTTKTTRWRARRRKGGFFYRSGQRGFAEVMAYYYIDAAARHVEHLGYKGSCRILGGSPGGVKGGHGKWLGGPLGVDASGTVLDNSWYSPGRGLFTFGTGGTNDAEDGEVILHEFGHALQDAICPDFGQSREAAAMGEGFGDYLAASFFAAKKADADRPLVITWGITPHKKNRPYLRRVNEKLDFDDFEDADDYEHTNGKIWSATLWDIRQALDPITADTLIVESHFQLDAFTTFARGARAILDADRNLYHGKHLDMLIRIFHHRRIRPVVRTD